jgi:alkylation response protein AidB-like acyl-CoA dehydrogenase
MVFDLTEEQRMIQEMARNFAQKEVLPKAAELDESGRYPRELVQQMAELAVGVAVPEEYEAGMDNVCCIAMGRSPGVRLHRGIMSVNNRSFDPLLKFGTEEQKRILVPLASAGSSAASG